MSGAPPPQPGELRADIIETDVLELLNNTAGVATVENLVGVAADSTGTDGTLVYPTSGDAQGVPTDLAVRIDGVDRPVTAIEYADATGTLRPVTEWHLGPLGEFALTLNSLTFVQPATFDVSITGTNGPVQPGETLDVTADITNTGDESGTQTITLDINNDVGQVDSASVSLSGGGSSTQTLSWSVPSGQTEQDYQATVASADDSDSTTVTVEVTIPAAITDYWPVDGSGDTVTNTEGTVDITVSGATRVSDSQAVDGQQLDFDGTDDYGNTDSDYAINQTQMTALIWVNADGFSSIFMTSVPDTPSDGWRINTNANNANSFNFAHRDNTADTTFQLVAGLDNSGAGYNTDTRYMLAMAMDGNDATCYVYDSNGLVESASGTGDRETGFNSDLWIGSREAQDFPLNGQLDGIALARGTQMSQSEIDQFYDATKP